MVGLGRQVELGIQEHLVHVGSFLIGLGVLQIARVSNNTKLRLPLGRGTCELDRYNLCERSSDLHEAHVVGFQALAADPALCCDDSVDGSELNVGVVFRLIPLVSDICFDFDSPAKAVAPITAAMASSNEYVRLDKPTCTHGPDTVWSGLETRKDLHDS